MHFYVNKYLKVFIKSQVIARVFVKPIYKECSYISNNFKSNRNTFMFKFSNILCTIALKKCINFSLHTKDCRVPLGLQMMHCWLFKRYVYLWRLIADIITIISDWFVDDILILIINNSKVQWLVPSIEDLILINFFFTLNDFLTFGRVASKGWPQTCGPLSYFCTKFQLDTSKHYEMHSQTDTMILNW